PLRPKHRRSHFDTCVSDACLWRELQGRVLRFGEPAIALKRGCLPACLFPVYRKYWLVSNQLHPLCRGRCISTKPEPSCPACYHTDTTDITGYRRRREAALNKLNVRAEVAAVASC